MNSAAPTTGIVHEFPSNRHPRFARAGLPLPQLQSRDPADGALAAPLLAETRQRFQQQLASKDADLDKERKFMADNGPSVKPRSSPWWNRPSAWWVTCRRSPAKPCQRSRAWICSGLRASPHMNRKWDNGTSHAPHVSSQKPAWFGLLRCCPQQRPRSVLRLECLLG